MSEALARCPLTNPLHAVAGLFMANLIEHVLIFESYPFHLPSNPC